MNLCEILQCPEKVPTRLFSMFKARTCTFSIKNLFWNFAKWAFKHSKKTRNWDACLQNHNWQVVWLLNILKQGKGCRGHLRHCEILQIPIDSSIPLLPSVVGLWGSAVPELTLVHLLSWHKPPLWWTHLHLFNWGLLSLHYCIMYV